MVRIAFGIITHLHHCISPAWRLGYWDTIVTLIFIHSIILYNYRAF